MGHVYAQVAGLELSANRASLIQLCMVHDTNQTSYLLDSMCAESVSLESATISFTFIFIVLQQYVSKHALVEERAVLPTTALAQQIGEDLCVKLVSFGHSITMIVCV